MPRNFRLTPPMGNLSQFHNLLNLNSFTPGNQTKDFGVEIPYCFYFSRKLSDGGWQYVSLVNYDDEFVEAVYELYKGEKNTRDKKQGAVSKMLYRNLELLKERILSEK